MRSKEGAVSGVLLIVQFLEQPHQRASAEFAAAVLIRDGGGAAGRAVDFHLRLSGFRGFLKNVVMDLHELAADHLGHFHAALVFEIVLQQVLRVVHAIAGIAVRVVAVCAVARVHVTVVDGTRKGRSGDRVDDTVRRSRAGRDTFRRGASGDRRAVHRSDIDALIGGRASCGAGRARRRGDAGARLRGVRTRRNRCTGTRGRCGTRTRCSCNTGTRLIDRASGARANTTLVARHILVRINDDRAVVETELHLVEVRMIDVDDAVDVEKL